MMYLFGLILNEIIDWKWLWELIQLGWSENKTTHFNMIFPKPCWYILNYDQYTPQLKQLASKAKTHIKSGISTKLWPNFFYLWIQPQFCHVFPVVKTFFYCQKLIKIYKRKKESTLMRTRLRLGSPSVMNLTISATESQNAPSFKFPVLYKLPLTGSSMTKIIWDKLSDSDNLCKLLWPFWIWKTKLTKTTLKKHSLKTNDK